MELDAQQLIRVGDSNRTGGTGVLGSAVSDELLAAGYRVRVLIRNAEKAKVLTGILDKKHGAELFSTVLVEDCACVIHTLSDSFLSPDPHKVITGSVVFVKNVLSAAAKTPSVKRFVYTSSQAVLPPITEPGVITSASRRPNADELVSYAWAEPHTPEEFPLVYTASKVCEEKVCWEFLEREKPDFVFNIIIPGFFIGEVYHPKLISRSNKTILGLLQSHPGAMGFVSAISPTNFIHLAALTTDRVRNRSLLALGEIFDLNCVVDILDKLVPENNLPPKLESIEEAVAEYDKSFEDELQEELGYSTYVNLEDSITQCVKTASGGTTSA